MLLPLLRASFEYLSINVNFFFWLGISCIRSKKYTFIMFVILIGLLNKKKKRKRTKWTSLWEERSQFPYLKINLFQYIFLNCKFMQIMKPLFFFRIIILFYLTYFVRLCSTFVIINCVKIVFTGWNKNDNYLSRMKERKKKQKNEIVWHSFN